MVIDTYPAEACGTSRMQHGEDLRQASGQTERARQPIIRQISAGNSRRSGMSAPDPAHRRSMHR
ncbi:MAG: hypothetical protein R3D28_17535 [Geminicoccaceae bacterium]